MDLLRFHTDRACLKHSPSGLTTIPEDIPDDTTLLDLQNNKITEIKENDFKNLKGLHVRNLSHPSAGLHVKYF